MGWSNAFIETLGSRQIMLGFQLRAWLPIDPPDGYLFGGVQTLATHDEGDGRPWIVDVEVAGDEINPYDMSGSTLGEWALLVAVADVADLQPMGPGNLVALEAFDLTNSATVERILLGISYGIERVTDALYRIRFRSALSILGSRYTDTAESLALFGDQSSTERSEVLAWTPGDAQLLCDSVSGFSTETGSDGVIRVTPHADNAAGTDVFYLRWTGTTGTAFDLDSGFGALDTTAVELDAVLAHPVHEVWFCEDHPLRVALKLLASSGTGANGTYDTLPSTWGMGFTADTFDAADTEYWIAQSSPATGSDKWQIWTATEQTNPGEWLIGVLASGGWWLTMRQGRITGRALVPAADRPELAEVEITDDDLIEWVEVESYDLGSDVGAKQVRAIGPTVTGTLTEDITRLPAVRYSDVNVATYAHANEEEWVTEIAERLGPWLTRQSERRVGRFAGLRLAQLAPGSIVHLTVSGPGRLAPYERRVALVGRVAPRWMGAEVELTLYVHPARGEA